MHMWTPGAGAVADPGGGGSRGSGPPLFVPRCRLFNIGPKIGPPSAPPFFAGRPNLGPPPFQNPGSAPEESLPRVTSGVTPGATLKSDP